MEAAQPLLQARVIGVDVVDGDFGLAGRRFARRGDDAQGDFRASGEGAQRPAAVAHKHVGGGHGACERPGDAGGGVFGQHGVGRGAGTVARHEDGDVFEIASGMPGFAASATGLARQTGAPALGRFENEGFVGFDNSLQTPRLVERRGAQEAMAPTIGRGGVNAATLGRLGQTDAFRSWLAIIACA